MSNSSIETTYLGIKVFITSVTDNQAKKYIFDDYKRQKYKNIEMFWL
jgi:hypothetical protein